MNIRVSDVDVDGIIAFGKLPLVNFLDKGSIDLNDLKLIPMGAKLKSASVTTRAKYSQKSILYIGTTGGTPYYLVTSLLAQELQQILLEFISQSNVSEIGYVNGWLNIGNETAADLRKRIVVSNCSTVVVTVEFLKNLSKWLIQSRPDDSEIVLGGLFWFGMRMPPAIFFSNFQHNVCWDYILAAHIHLGVEIKNMSGVPCIVSLKPEVRAEFPGSGTMWFHPYGLIDGANIISQNPSKLVQYHQTLVQRQIDSIRMYQPELMHCRTPDIRLQRAACAGAALIGGPWVKSGYYQAKCQSVSRWAHCIETGLHGVYLQGSVLRIEYVMPFRNNLGPAYILEMRQQVKLFFTEQHRLSVIPTSEIPYHELIEPAIRIVQTASIQHFRQVVAAEAYLGLLIDGGTLRCYYPGLKAALGMTISRALDSNGVIVAPKTATFHSTTWEDLWIHKLAVPVAFFLKISSDSAHKILQLLVAKYPLTVPLADKRHGKFWIDMVKLLLSIDTGNEQVDCWNVAHHQRNGQLFATISPKSLVDVLLHERPIQSHNKLRVLACTFIRSYIDRSFPGLPEVDKKSRLEMLIMENISVFPHSVPASSRDRSERWWRVGSDPDAKLLEHTFQWMANRLPRTLESVPTMAKITTDSAIVGTGWFLISRFLDSDANVAYKNNELKQFFRVILVVILATALEQRRRNDFKFHPYILWGEWRITMGQNIDLMFSEFEKWNILTPAPAGAPSRETLFALWQVPDRMPERLESLRELFCRTGIIPRPVTQRGDVNVAEEEIEPINDGIPNDEDDDGVPLPVVIKRHRRHADITIALQEEIVLERRR